MSVNMQHSGCNIALQSFECQLVFAAWQLVRQTAAGKGRVGAGPKSTNGKLTHPNKLS